MCNFFLGVAVAKIYRILQRRNLLLTVCLFIAVSLGAAGIWKVLFNEKDSPQPTVPSESMVKGGSYLNRANQDREEGNQSRRAGSVRNDPSPPSLRDPRGETVDGGPSGRLLPGGMDREEAIRKFRHARNLYDSDPTLSQAEKEKIISKLAESIFGKDAEIPETTEEDLREQERMRQVMVEFKEKAEAIKKNTGLTREEQVQEVQELFHSFLEKMDSAKK